jgi:antitoxin component YwqK of YwqJK toxin-antitoxin module
VYSESGKKAGEGVYVDKKKQGEWTYFDDSLRVRSVEQYVNGMKHGFFKLFYPDGKLLEESEYKNDKREGLSRQYYPNGQVKSQLTYKNDVLTGPGRYFTPDGKLEAAGEYDEKGLKTGWWSKYDKNGFQIERIEYKNGMPVGKNLYKKEDKPIKVETPDGPKE